MKRTYTCTAVFVDPRIKPRVVVVEGDNITKSDARRQARSVIAEAHPTWELDKVTATMTGEVEKPAGKVVGKVEGKRRPKGRKPADPVKKAAAEAATKEVGATLTQLHKDGDAIGVTMWWGAYKTYTAEARAKADEAAAATA